MPIRRRQPSPCARVRQCTEVNAISGESPKAPKIDPKKLMRPGWGPRAANATGYGQYQYHALPEA